MRSRFAVGRPAHAGLSGTWPNRSTLKAPSAPGGLRCSWNRGKEPCVCWESRGERDEIGGPSEDNPLDVNISFQKTQSSKDFRGGICNRTYITQISPPSPVMNKFQWAGFWVAPDVDPRSVAECVRWTGTALRSQTDEQFPPRLTNMGTMLPSEHHEAAHLSHSAWDPRPCLMLLCFYQLDWKYLYFTNHKKNISADIMTLKS